MHRRRWFVGRSYAARRRRGSTGRICGSVKRRRTLGGKHGDTGAGRRCHERLSRSTDRWRKGKQDRQDPCERGEGLRPTSNVRDNSLNPAPSPVSAAPLRQATSLRAVRRTCFSDPAPSRSEKRPPRSLVAVPHGPSIPISVLTAPRQRMTARQAGGHARARNKVGPVECRSLHLYPTLTVGLPIVIDLVSISSLLARIPRQPEPRSP
jgi:hypothetical protein